jgi:hypothetical protein
MRGPRTVTRLRETLRSCETVN